MPEVKDKNYCIQYTLEQALVTCEGSLLLNGAVAYEPILNVLKQAADEQEPKKLDVDIRGLKFMNSSAINMMTKFVMYVSDVKELKLVVTIIALRQVAWQERLCINLQRLMPALQSKLE
jgi:hypothetical protein